MDTSSPLLAFAPEGQLLSATGAATRALSGFGTPVGSAVSAQSELLEPVSPGPGLPDAPLSEGRIPGWKERRLTSRGNSIPRTPNQLFGLLLDFIWTLDSSSGTTDL